MSDIHKPNLTLALAASYNTRGQTGFAMNFTTGIDQRKINSMYMLVKNALTGQTTLYLCKRPGVEIKTEDFGATGQVTYLVASAPSQYDYSYTQTWVFYTVTGPERIRVSDAFNDETILTSDSYRPQYVSYTSISGTKTAVLQTILPGTGAQKTFFASLINSWTEITDGVFIALSQLGQMEHMNGSGFIMESRGRIYNSGLNTLATWGANDYCTKNIQQDISMGLAKFGSQMLAFGKHTMEVFQYTEVSYGSPLKSVKELASETGLVAGADNTANVTNSAGHYYAIVKGLLYFVGREGKTKQSIGVFAWNGQRAEKVSNIAIDNILSSLPFDSTNQIFSVNAFSFHGQAALSIAIDSYSATTQRWLVYFPEWREWFEWNSTVFSPITNGTQFRGLGTNQHRIYSMQEATASENYQDNGTNYTFTHQFKLPQSSNDRQTMSMAGVVGDTARSASSLNVEFSDDDGQNWTTPRIIDMTTDRKAVYRCGSYRNRHVRLSSTANVDVRLEKFVARVT